MTFRVVRSLRERTTRKTDANGPHAEACGPFCFVSGSFTSPPWVWKAHGTATGRPGSGDPEPRLTRLAQTGSPDPGRPVKAVLEQPSSRWALGETLGRRNIGLSQSDELNTTRHDGAVLTVVNPRCKKIANTNGTGEASPLRFGCIDSRLLLRLKCGRLTAPPATVDTVGARNHDWWG